MAEASAVQAGGSLAETVVKTVPDLVSAVKGTKSTDRERAKALSDLKECVEKAVELRSKKNPSKGDLRKAEKCDALAKAYLFVVHAADGRV